MYQPRHLSSLCWVLFGESWNAVGLDDLGALPSHKFSFKGKGLHLLLGSSSEGNGHGDWAGRSGQWAGC